MPASFKDHFSAHASDYARYRPGYPEALFAYLASRCDTRELAWDCGTGNGQAARGLAAHFARVVATDASADQLAHAAPHPRVAYHVAPAAHSPLADAVITAYHGDLVGAYWPPERRLVDEAYRTIPFPFDEETPPAFHLDVAWDLSDLLGYLGTWSATRRYARARGVDPVALIRDDLARAWGEPEAKKAFQWPVHLRVGRVAGRDGRARIASSSPDTRSLE